MGEEIMKFLFVLFIMAFSHYAWAAANDLVLNQRNSTDTGSFNRFPTVPTTTNGLLGFNISTILPEWWTLGSTLAVTGTTLDVVGMPAAQVNSDWNAVSGVAQILNKPTIPTIPTHTFSPVTRSLNTCFQPSSTRDMIVDYGVEIATTSTLVSGGVGSAFLETFTDNACTLGTQEVARVTNGNVQTLGLTVTMTQTFGSMLSSVIQAGQWVKIRTANVTGTPTFTARPGLEVAF